jgi:hypothetical protein
MTMASARAFDETKYPDWRGKWDRVAAMWDEITVIDNALTGPWTVKKKYTRDPNQKYTRDPNQKYTVIRIPASTIGSRRCVRRTTRTSKSKTTTIC